MKKHLLFFSLLASLAACTQDPARVEYKGAEWYGRQHQEALDSAERHETYGEDSPRYKPGYARPVEQAAVGSVGVSDLPPPAPQGSPAPSPLAQASPASGHLSHPPEPLISEAKPATGKSQFAWPISGGKVISHFGPKEAGKSNDGINISVAEGEPIWAAADGMVVYAGNELKGYGNMVIVRHEDGWMTAYAHARNITVRKHDYVKQGEIIGYVGTTGGVKSPQLHFALRRGRTPVDPEQYLPNTLASQ